MKNSSEKVIFLYSKGIKIFSEMVPINKVYFAYMRVFSEVTPKVGKQI